MSDAPSPPPPNPSEAVMTGEQLAEAKLYGRYSLACTLADKALDLLFLTYAAVVLARPLDAWLQGFGWLAHSMSLRLVVFFLLTTFLHMAVSLPLSFYSGHVLEHRFHLSTLSLSGWVRRYLKQNSLAVVFGAILILGLYWLIWTTGSWWWLTAAAAFFIVSIVLGRLAPVLILPLFYKIEKLDSPELADRMSRLADGTGLSIEGVYRMALSDETVKANAMLAGMGRTRRVLMGDTLLDSFSPEEIEVIFAHEIGHHVHRHIRKLIFISLLFSAAGFWICNRSLLALVPLEPGQLNIYSALPVWTQPWIMLILTLFATLLEPLQNALSRHHERQSDRYALQRTGRPDAYISAFRKLARLNKDDPSPHWLEVFWFHSHPPIGERLAMADER